MTVWGVPSTYRLLSIPPVPTSDFVKTVYLEAAQKVSLLKETEAVSGFVLGSVHKSGSESVGRDVLFAAAAAPEIRSKVQPLIDAGFRIDGLTTPPLALCSIAYLRRNLHNTATVAVLAVRPRMMALSVVRDQFVLLAREIPWGWERFGAQSLDREQFIAQLLSELRRSMLWCRTRAGHTITNLIICGDAPDVRSLSCRLGKDLQIPIESLDSLEELIAVAIEPSELFQNRMGELGLAWAMAADTAPPFNLIPPEIVSRRQLGGRAISFAAGTTAAIIMGATTYGYFDGLIRSHEARAREFRQEITHLAPRVRQVEQLHRAGITAAARRDTLESLDSQGPRLGRTLELLGHSTPQDLTLKSLKLTSAGTKWTGVLSGVANTADTTRAQAAVGELLEAIQASQYFGAPVRKSASRYLGEFEVAFEMRK